MVVYGGAHRFVRPRAGSLIVGCVNLERVFSVHVEAGDINRRGRVVRNRCPAGTAVVAVGIAGDGGPSVGRLIPRKGEGRQCLVGDHRASGFARRLGFVRYCDGEIGSVFAAPWGVAAGDGYLEAVAVVGVGVGGMLKVRRLLE